MNEVGTNYLLVQKGWLFTTDLYVPLAAVTSVGDDHVVLNVRKDEVEHFDWSSPPAQAVVDAPDVTRTAQMTDTAEFGTTAIGSVSDQATTDEVVVPITEEEVRIGTREVERGAVRVTTRVEERPVQEQVTLRDEQVTVERRAVDRPVSATEITQFQEGVFEVRETDEEAIVEKRAEVVEEVVISKDVAERTETVRDTVRRTDVDVDDLNRDDSLDVTDTTTTRRTTSDRTGRV